MFFDKELWIYVDESYNDDYFVYAGFCTPEPKIYNKFIRKELRNINLRSHTPKKEFHFSN